MQRRQRHSVATFPYITNASDNSEVENADLLELVKRRRQSVACQGQTVTLHARSSGQNQESSRKISLSYKPFLSVPQPSPTRRNSTSSVSSRSSFSLPNENSAIDDQFSSSTLSLTTNQNAVGNLSATGSEILDDSKKLPKILLTAPADTKQVKKKKRKKKKAGNNLETASKDEFPSLIEEDGAGVSLETPNSTENKVKNIDKSEEDSIDWKYKLEAKYFQLGWNTTKAFTYSYFPKCEKVRTKERKKKKIAKNAGSSHLHVKT